MKLWIDDVRPAPEGYVWCKSVEEAKETIVSANARFADAFRKGLEPDHSLHIEIIDLDHDAGDYASDGGDYIKLLDKNLETEISQEVFEMLKERLNGNT